MIYMNWFETWFFKLSDDPFSDLLFSNESNQKGIDQVS